MEERILEPSRGDEKTHQLDEDFELSLRPQYLSEYIGQEAIKKNLQVYIQAAQKRNEVLDHVLLFGPPGLGKTTLAAIIANEMGGSIKYTAGPVLKKAGDLAAILTSLAPGDVLFIDEIHRLPQNMEEMLYSALEDFCIDLIIGKEETSRSIRVDLAPFTLVSATTRICDLSAPLRDRFGIVERLRYYTHNELALIIKRTARILQTEIAKEAIADLALRSRGTPRIANRILKRVRDFAQVKNDSYIDSAIVEKALQALGIDGLGLDFIDHKIIKGIIEQFNGGPVGLETLSATIGEEAQTIEDVYEPYLLQNNLLKRTQRGRVATKKAYEHFQLEFMKNV